MKAGWLLVVALLVLAEMCGKGYRHGTARYRKARSQRAVTWCASVPGRDLVCQWF